MLWSTISATCSLVLSPTSPVSLNKRPAITEVLSIGSKACITFYSREPSLYEYFLYSIVSVVLQNGILYGGLGSLSYFHR
jgi:hypothetical protein